MKAFLEIKLPKNFFAMFLLRKVSFVKVGVLVQSK